MEVLEVWKDVVGYEGVYMVSNIGNVRKNKCGKLLKLVTNDYGYYIVTLTIPKISTSQHYIHRLVCFAFYDKPEDKPQVNHKNGIKTDNRVENLEWVTASENMKHYRENLKGLDLPKSRRNNKYCEITLRVSSETKARLMKEAKKDNRTLSNYIRIKLEK